jgi:N-terminal acetyltransferase B complex non-catalytic subunit
VIKLIRWLILIQALKIYIRSRSPLITEKSAVLLHLEELPSRKTPIRDLEVITLYDEAWGEIFPNKQGSWPQTIGELRWQAVKASPKNEEDTLKCFQECLANDDLDHARQVRYDPQAPSPYSNETSIDCSHPRKNIP